MKQMQQQESLQPIHGQLNAIWRNSNNVAAICYVVSRKVHGQRADEALLAGLLHQIGRLYILTHAHKNDPTLLQDQAYLEVVQSWHADIGKAILESWALPETICAAVAAQDALLAEEMPQKDSLGSLLSAATLRNRLSSDPKIREWHPHADDLIQMVELNGNNFLDLIVANRDDIESMQHILSS